MLRYACLVLDHDDTVVQSEETVNYPCFLESLKKLRPGETISLSDYVNLCGTQGFIPMCRQRFQMSDAELEEEYADWKKYAASHIPAPYPGLRRLLLRYREAGGKVFVVSQSTDAKILRDYQLHFGFVPDGIYGWDRPQEQRKPNPYALFDIMEKTGLSRDDVLVVDDLPSAHPMARAAGMDMAFAGWGKANYPAIAAQMQGLCRYSFYTVEDFANFLFC